MRNIFILILTMLVTMATAQVDVNMSRTGIIKTKSGQELGGAFVAMNKNVVFTAAHIITFEEELTFQNKNGESFPLRIVATDPEGDIAVFMTSNDISQKPFAINLNYQIDDDTRINVMPSTAGQKSAKTNVAAALVKEKSISTHKNMEYQSLDLATKAQPSVGSPLLNANNEVIGIVTTSSKKGSTVSMLDSDLWDKM